MATDETTTTRRGLRAVDPDEVMAAQGLPETTVLTREQSRRVQAEAAAALRVAGASYAEIAKMLEYDTAALARQAVEKVLASTVDESKDYQSLRAIESIRLEGLYRAVAARALDEEDGDQLAYHRAALSVLDRIAKLHGLDAPQRVELITPGAEEFDLVLGRLRAIEKTGAYEPDLDELDVIDAEWEEGDHDDAELAGADRVEAEPGRVQQPDGPVPDEPGV